VKLTLPVPPSANRWHRTINGRPILSREARLYTQAIKHAIVEQQAGYFIAGVPLAVSIAWFRERKSGDIDKRGAIMLDALQGICYANDSQIKRYTIERFEDKQNPRMEITIEEAA
jgi:Holliday junction resolvase RusA-like endonuclease